jgi:excisionase family DNA binding protein
MTKAEVPEHLRELAAELPLTMTLGEAAKVLCLHPRSVQRMVAAGELRGMKTIAGASPARVIIPRSELMRWLAAHPAR